VARTFAPETVGLQRKIVWGNATLGKGALEKKLQQMKIEYKPQQLTQILDEIDKRLKAIKSYPVWLSDLTVEAVCQAVLDKDDTANR
jgi:isopropylmalate/homocitrate/citramalate synthase